MLTATSLTKPDGTLHTNVVWTDTSARLSVLVPYLDYDVAPLARVLIGQAERLESQVEILFADDGSRQTQHTEAIKDIFSNANVACGLYLPHRNLGRSCIRNRLVGIARGAHVLFLDSDMLPDSSDYLKRYLDLCAEREPGVIYGGRSYQQIASCPADRRLYRYYSLKAECMPAAMRQREPYWYVLTNNLLVRRSLLQTYPFDESFSGWGYEDTEWSLRIRGASMVLHIDNTATHMDLISDDALLRKYNSSIANYFHILERQPEEFSRFKIYRASRKLASFPLPFKSLKAILASLMLARFLPLALRFASMQLYRACLYGGAMRERRSH